MNEIIQYLINWYTSQPLIGQFIINLSIGLLSIRFIGILFRYIKKYLDNLLEEGE